MATPVKHNPNGFYLEAIAPVHDPLWARITPRGRTLFWNEAARLGLAKRRSGIMRGIGRNGERVKDISVATRMHRKSAMTKSGKGSPSASPLVPGYTLSRAYQYLRYSVEAASDRVWFQYRYDSHTRMNWGEIMAFQAKAGRDHLGFNFDEWDAIASEMDRWFNARRVQLSAAVEAPAPRPVVPLPVPKVARPAALVTPPFAAPGPAFSVPLANPIGNRVASAEDKANVRAANAAGMFSGWRRNAPWSDPLGIVKGIRARERAAAIRRRNAARRPGA